MPDSDPWFIFTFTAQQINCLRDAEGTVVIGKIKCFDIRAVRSFVLTPCRFRCCGRHSRGDVQRSFKTTPGTGYRGTGVPVAG